MGTGHQRRDQHWLVAAAVIAITSLGMACGTNATGTDATPTDATTPAPSTSTTGASGDEPVDTAALEHGVIVDLAVDWRPEHELGDGEVAAQRERIQEAENAVMAALGSHGRVRRQLHATAQVSLAADDEGLQILQDLAEVAAVHQDTADPPN